MRDRGVAGLVARHMGDQMRDAFLDLFDAGVGLSWRPNVNIQAL